MFISPDLTRKQQKVDKELRTELKKVSRAGRKSGQNKVWEDSKKRQREGCSAVSDSTAQLDTTTNRIDCVHALFQSTAHALKYLLNKVDILKTHVYEMGVDIIGVAETFYVMM